MLRALMTKKNTVLYLRACEAWTFSFPSNTLHKLYIFAALRPLLGNFLAFFVYVVFQEE
jgi:hypothetical protein